MIRTEEDPASAFLEGTKSLQAEHYGGAGLGVHGGGVRCGWDGEHQFKGIGRNVLAGVGAPLDYSHGGASLFECVQEAIWGEIFHYALPYSAVRIPVVLATQTRCWWVVNRWGEDLLRERYGADVYLPRGVMIREGAIRPAHFERAMLYSPLGRNDDLHYSDVARVRAAVNVLPHVLPQPAESLPGASGVLEKLGIGMLEVARRFAEQDAAAKAKRLVHGNIGSSNICLDGRWIDFGSVTALPGWGDLGGYGDFWDESVTYSSIFSTLIFNIKKYFPESGPFLPSVDDLITRYRDVHCKDIKRRFLAHAGIPFVLLSPNHSCRSEDDLYRILMMVARAGHREPFEGHPDDDSSFGTYNLGLILHCLACDHSPSERDRMLSLLLPDSTLKIDLVKSFDEVRGIATINALNLGVRPRSLCRLMVIITAKVSKTVKMFYRAHMVRRCEEIVLLHRDMGELRGAVQEWFDQLSNTARVLFEDPAGLSATIWWSKTGSIRYDAVEDIFNVENEMTGKLLFSNLDDLTLAVPNLANEAKRFWGAEVWGHMR